MIDTMRALALRLLRVPPRPQAPAGDRDNVLMFRAGKRYFYYGVALWTLKQLGALAALIGGTFFFYFIAPNDAALEQFARLGVLELFAWTIFLVQLPLSFMLVRLDFEMRWYLLAERSLRIREGMFVVREKTMSYANIQNISVHRNPLQRMFGLATIAVRAAGGGSGSGEKKGRHGGGHSHEARFEGVENVDEVRQILRDRIRNHRDSGLGDPDDAPAASSTHSHLGTGPGGSPTPPGLTVAAASTASVEAARNLLAEARALRAAAATGATSV